MGGPLARFLSGPCPELPQANRSTGNDSCCVFVGFIERAGIVPLGQRVGDGTKSGGVFVFDGFRGLDQEFHPAVGWGHATEDRPTLLERDYVRSGFQPGLLSGVH